MVYIKAMIYHREPQMIFSCRVDVLREHAIHVHVIRVHTISEYIARVHFTRVL